MNVMRKNNLYKIKDVTSGLYWKGGGMNFNNKSCPFVKRMVDGKYQYEKIDYDSENDARAVCFSKGGKTWSSFSAVKLALNYGHEPGLNSLLSKCAVMEIELIEREVERNR